MRIAAARMGGEVGTARFEHKTIRKLQWRVLPFTFVLYVISFLDRINIGFAALTMNKELAISSQQFGFLAGIFFFGYVLSEVPSNLMLHKVGARIWIARILVSWGLLATLTGFVRTPHQLYWMRFLLGLAEGGYFPGIVLYLTYWFRRREQAQGIALFLTGLPVSSILGAPLSGWILDHVHWMNLGSWRWLLILEGVPAIVFGVVTYFYLPSRPAEAKFLSEEEKNWLTGELQKEERAKQAAHSITALQVLTKVRVWHLGLIVFTVNIGVYTLSFWLPQMVKSFSSGYSNQSVGWMVMIPHVAGLIGMVLISRSSDRKMERRLHAAIPATFAGAALVSLSATHSVALTIALLAIAAAGMYSVYGPTFSLPSEFLCGYAAASGLALVSMISNTAGFVGPYITGWISQKTGNLRLGLLAAGISVLAGAVLALVLPKKVKSSSASADQEPT